MTKNPSFGALLNSPLHPTPFTALKFAYRWQRSEELSSVQMGKNPFTAFEQSVIICHPFVKMNQAVQISPSALCSLSGQRWDRSPL